MSNSKPIEIRRRQDRIFFDSTLSNDHIVSTIRRSDDFYEADLLDWLATLNLPPGSVVDVGAFIGNHTLYFACLMGRRVFAFEPNAVAFESLQRSIALNDIAERVTASMRAVAAEQARAILSTEAETNLGGTRVVFDDTGEVEVDRLDDLLPQDEPVALIKVDVEGLELDVLRGASGTMRRCRPMLAIECMTHAALRAVAAHLVEVRYAPMSVFAATPVVVFCPIEKADEVFWGKPPSFFHEYREHRNRLFQTSLARKHWEDGSRARDRIVQLSEAATAKDADIQRLQAEAIEARERFRADFEALGRRWEARLESEKSVLEQSHREHARLDVERIEREAAARGESLNKRLATLEQSTAKEISRLQAELQARQDVVDALRAEADTSVHEAAALRAKLSETSKELADAYGSIRYELGDAIALALRKPGRQTLALPRRIGSALLRTARNRGSKPRQRGESTGGVERLLPFRRVKAPESLSGLRVACVMDEFSFLSFRYECELLQVTPVGWVEEVTAFKPHLLFIESAWHGKDGLWYRKINNASPELVDLVRWCNNRAIPTVFWNKEDPVHLDTFINTAHHFDYVFTTDVDCIGRYRSQLGHDRVSVLPFACQPAVQNPLESHDRKDRFCFSGGYYQRYPERARDLETVLDALGSTHGLDIYDRNHGQDDPRYQFPEKYEPYILGSLPFREIDVAYKGYRYGVNLNSIKQSQSMFARRVFELLASNTVTVSNYSRGLRLLLGDLVISTDSGAELRRRLAPILDDERAYRRLRLAGLRKVLLEHTYRHRLSHVASVAFDRKYDIGGPRVLVLGLAQTQAELVAVWESFRRQSYERKVLVLVLGPHLKPTDLPVDDDVRVLPWHGAKNRTLSNLPPAEFVAGLVATDYYGPSYLVDLALADRYSNADCFGKGARYVLEHGTANLTNDGVQYRLQSALSARSALVRRHIVEKATVADWVGNLAEEQFELPSCLAVDEFNYCKDAGPEVADQVDDAAELDKGIAIGELYAAADAAEAALAGPGDAQLSSALLRETIRPGVYDDVEVLDVGSRLIVRSKLDPGTHRYIYGEDRYPVSELATDGGVKVYLDVQMGTDIRMAFMFFGADGNKVDSAVLVANRNQGVKVPEGAVSARLGLRVAGPGESRINRLFLNHLDARSGCHVPKGRYLILSNLYPQYDDLYRYGFLHRRVFEYRNHGLLLDVMRFNDKLSVGFGEFENVDLATGFSDELHKALRTGRYEKVLVHFLNPDMWEVLQEYVDDIQVIVWLHGAEVQPWTRRAYNYTTARERSWARRESSKRMSFWRHHFGASHPNVHYVFVSRSLADEVASDVGIQLDPHQYSVIHNYIDTTLFEYVPKPAEQRKRILSIRPFATRKYANDLSVQAVLELSTESFFKELEFCFVGDGKLFEETVEPLRAFCNVELRRGFLTQYEIASLHRDYGLFLNPTRWDSQGVSRDEAMSSGLVPLTNRVAAIPEFVDDLCGILVGAEDASGLADGIRRLHADPELFLRMSAAAAERVRRQSALDSTIVQELALITGDPPAPSQVDHTFPRCSEPASELASRPALAVTR